MVDAAQLAERIAGRVAVEEFLDRVLKDASSEKRKAVYTAMAVKLPPEYCPKPEIRALSDAEAKKLANQPLTFGIHEGELLRDVPLDYIETLADTGLLFGRYLRSAEAQRIHATTVD